MVYVCLDLVSVGVIKSDVIDMKSLYINHLFA